MDNELFPVHTNRHSGHRGLPVLSQPPPKIQEKACGPESVVLPTGNHQQQPVSPPQFNPHSCIVTLKITAT